MRSVAPLEGVGYLKDGVFYPVPNIASDPIATFKANVPDDIDALIHSHPKGHFYPSYNDMLGQISMGCTWGIYAWNDEAEDLFFWGDDVVKEPLVGRGFRHGVTDCYEAVRDLYKARVGLNLRPYARAWQWHRAGANLYEENFAAEGFHEISGREILPGDAVLISIGSEVANHAGVYVGNGKVYHHLAVSRHGFFPSRLATIEPLSSFGQFPLKVLRHERNHTWRTFGKDFWTRP